jgi:hypothetical protein
MLQQTISNVALRITRTQHLVSSIYHEFGVKSEYMARVCEQTPLEESELLRNTLLSIDSGKAGSCV